MTHYWWFRFYVVVALASFITSLPSLTKNVRQWWDVKCSCCQEKAALWHRLAMIATCLVAYPVRAILWPLVMPVEFIVFFREEMHEREKQ